jgi:hypothetical protein
MASIYEGKGGGTGGASARLHLSAGGRPSVVCDAARWVAMAGRD